VGKTNSLFQVRFLQVFRAVVLPGLLLPGCVTSPKRPGPGRGAVWGYLRLVPPKGVQPGRKSDGPYTDRRLRGVKLVDYQRPGFAVVYLEGAAALKGQVRLTIKSSRFSVRLEPGHAAVGLGGTVRIVNTSAKPRTVSCPSGGIIRKLWPGESVEIPANSPGPMRVLLLGAGDTEATIFITPGPYALVSDSGRWELRDLAPGRLKLRAWHPRFPPAEREIEVSPGAVLRADIEIGVRNLNENQP
jgi:hypothetical protein